MRFRVRIDAEKCKGCGLCLAACVRKMLRLSAAFNAKGYRYAETDRVSCCTGCRQCADMCPEAAIEIDASTEADPADGEPDAKNTKPE